MEDRVRRVYVGESSIISSLGVGTSACVEQIASYTTNTKMWGDTLTCMIDRSMVDLESLPEYTFVEQLIIRAMEDVAQRSSVSICDPRTAVILSTTKGNVEMLNEDFERTYLWSVADRIKSYFGCEQTPRVISTACISGVAAVAVAARMVESGEVDSVYVVGVDTICDFIVDGFNSFKSISPGLCRPYDSSRCGLTIGEGCGVLLLSCDGSKSPSKVVVSGCGLSNDANHISGPSRSGDGLFFAIERAMMEAGVTASDIDYINLHGTGTAFNDEMESKAVNMASLLSSPCNSLKPYLGHTFGASGVIESILVVEQMRRGEIFGVRGYESCGVPYELNVSAEHRRANIDHALKTASGFGGTNGAVVFSQELALKMKLELEDDRPTEIETIAHVEMDSSQAELPFGEFIKGEYRALEEANLKFFKMDGLSKLGYVAACRLMQGVSLDLLPQRIGVVMANRSSSSQSDLKHQSIVNQKLEEGASPAVFVYTLPNIVASQISIKHKFQGETLFFVEENKPESMEYLKAYSEKLISRGVCEAVLYGWCEQLEESYNVELILIKKV